MLEAQSETRGRGEQEDKQDGQGDSAPAETEQDNQGSELTDNGMASDTENEPVFCSCRRPDDGNLMVACDGCDEWFHAACVNITEEEAEESEEFFCQLCRRNQGVKRSL
jgi:COMPASS component SPP1